MRGLLTEGLGPEQGRAGAGSWLGVGAVMRALGQRERSSQSGSMQKSHRSSPSLEQREVALGGVSHRHSQILKTEEEFFLK